MSAVSGFNCHVPLTKMSGVTPVRRRARVAFERLVRSSHRRLVAVLTLATSGCIYQEPPDWSGPPRTAPLLTNPVPPFYEVISVDSSTFSPSGETQLSISVNERSEDNGDSLLAIWYLYYNSAHTNDVSFQNLKPVAPGHWEDEKTISFNWDVLKDANGRSGTDACLPLTLIVTHASNVENSNEHFPIDNEDVALITWWLSFNNTNPSGVLCPVGTGAI